ncbi:MAG: hypothetical protein F7B11_05590 [Caldisphaeraceae archaeon]|nr:hypothetical protein [Caldisphaeraceae archaeon]
MVKEEYTCVVCGKKFYPGQGIVLQRGSLRLFFHSSKCASKFFKMLLDRVDSSCIDNAALTLIKDLEKNRADRGNKKVIA